MSGEHQRQLQPQGKPGAERLCILREERHVGKRDLAFSQWKRRGSSVAGALGSALCFVQTRCWDLSRTQGFMDVLRKRGKGLSEPRGQEEPRESICSLCLLPPPSGKLLLLLQVQFWQKFNAAPARKGEEKGGREEESPAERRSSGAPGRLRPAAELLQAGEALQRARFPFPSAIPAVPQLPEG